MQRATCEQCGERQPPEWKSGDLCTRCGSAARREVRCAWCTRWTPAAASGGNPARFCRACGCDVIEPELFGAARMLKDAGIDRLTLAERLRALEPGRLATFSAQYAMQWAIVARRVDEARLCESFLFHRGFTADLEDDYVPTLPMSPAALEELSRGPSGPFAGRADLLEEIEAKSPAWQTKSLATLALLRLGRITDARVETVFDLAYSGNGAIGVEAALALAHWKIRGSRESRYDESSLRMRVGWIALEAISIPAARPYAALASAWSIEPHRRASWRSGHDRVEEWAALLEPHLREGLASSDADLRFGCALILHDEAALAPMLDAPDETMRELARNALASKAGSLVRRRMVTGTAEERRAILRQLPTPWDAASLDAVLDSYATAEPDFRRDALRWIQSRKFEEIEPGPREAIARFVQQSASILSTEEILDFLEWAATIDGNGFAGETTVAPFLDVAADRLRSLAHEEREKAIDDAHAGFRRWLGYARESDRPIVASWLSTDVSLDPTWSALRNVESDLERASGSNKSSLVPLEIFLSIWDRFTPAERLAFARMAWDKKDIYYLGGNVEFFARFWKRFVDSEDDRLAISLLLRKTRQEYELDEAIKKELAAWPRGGKDPLATFEVLLSLDPERVYDALHAVLPGIDPSIGPALWAAVFAACEPLATKSTNGLPPIGRLIRWFQDAFDHDPLGDAAAPFRAMLPDFERAARAAMAKAVIAPGEERAWAGLKLVELDEELVRLHTTVDEAAERQREKESRERERLEREAEQARREEERQRAERDSADRRATMPADGGQPTTGGTGNGIDDEPLLPGQPLKTLRQYAAFIRSIQKGGDVMALMKDAGVDPMTWGACVGAWSTIFSARPELALRFSQLLSS